MRGRRIALLVAVTIATLPLPLACADRGPLLFPWEDPPPTWDAPANGHTYVPPTLRRDTCPVDPFYEFERQRAFGASSLRLKRALRRAEERGIRYDRYAPWGYYYGYGYTGGVDPY